MYQPSAAERARTVLRVAPSVSLLTTRDRTLPLRVLGADETGAPLLAAATEDHGADASCVVHAIDVSPTPLPDRIRAEVWVGGWLATVPASEVAALPVRTVVAGPVLRLDVAEVRLRDRIFGDGQLVHIDPVAYAGADPDPLADDEADCLSHLLAAHQGEYDMLCRLVPRPDGGTLAPLGLDRHGLLLRLDTAAGHRTVRLPFPAPVSCPGQLPAAMNQLLHAASAYQEKGV